MTLFKKIIDGEIPAKVVYEDDNTLAFLDISQGTPGHTLVIPKITTASAMTADLEIVAEMNKKSVEIAKMLKPILNCTGFNFITNAGEDAGQTVGHYHIHIIPRYHKDELSYVFKDHNTSLDEVYNLIKEKRPV